MPVRTERQCQNRQRVRRVASILEEALNRVMSNRTVFAIAHRLSTIRHADCIVVLKEGRIAEAGTHDELLKLNGLYRKLHDTQFDLNN